MDKETLLGEVARAGAARLVSRDELLAAFTGGAGEQPLSQKRDVAASLSTLLYFLGGAIVAAGVVVLIYHNWEHFGDAARVLSTLGSGIAAFVVALLLGRYEKLRQVGTAFHLVAAVTLPVGLHVTYHVAGIDLREYIVQASISGILLLVYGLSWRWYKQTLFVLFAIIFGSWFYFAITGYLVDGTTLFDRERLWLYQILMAGLAYVLLGYAFVSRKYRVLTSWLYSAGAIFFLGAALGLGGWPPRQSIFWELLYPALVFGAIFLSIVLKSRSFLIFGSLFLVLYIFKISAAYFADSLGWPLVLVVFGLVVIGIGYGTYYLYGRYLPGSASRAAGSDSL